MRTERRCSSKHSGRRLQREGRGHRKAITPKTKLLILNSPSNPTAASCPRTNTHASSRFARSTTLADGDECYSHFTYEPHKPYSIASAAGSKENVIIIGSVSKTFAMTGWRIATRSDRKR